MKDRLGANNPCLAKRPIYLVGVMGCGKSRVGSNLAWLSGRRFVDLDDWIVAKEGEASVSAIFQTHGEAHWRKLETAALKQPQNQGALVIATGGGIVLKKENVALMKKRGCVVWLERSLDVIVRTVNTKKRPLLAEGAEKLYGIYEERRSLYQKAATLRFFNDYVDSRAAARALMAALSSWEGEKP